MRQELANLQRLTIRDLGAVVDVEVVSVLAAVLVKAVLVVQRELIETHHTVLACVATMG